MIALLWLFGCGIPITQGTCETLCDHMYMECEFGAYPSYESCLQGCAYEQSEGADVDGQLQCIEKAGCDTFGIVECQHRFGVDGTGG